MAIDNPKMYLLSEIVMEILPCVLLLIGLCTKFAFLLRAYLFVKVGKLGFGEFPFFNMEIAIFEFSIFCSDFSPLHRPMRSHCFHHCPPGSTNLASSNKWFFKCQKLWKLSNKFSTVVLVPFAILIAVFLLYDFLCLLAYFIVYRAYRQIKGQGMVHIVVNTGGKMYGNFG
jgi:hypothetical protein